MMLDRRVDESVNAEAAPDAEVMRRALTDVSVDGVPVVSNNMIAPFIVLLLGEESDELNFTGGLEFQCAPDTVETLRDPQGKNVAMVRELIAASRRHRGE
jgi:hypothetical protein